MKSSYSLFIKTSILLILVSAAACGVSKSSENFRNEISKTADNLAIRGYDVVAYRTIDAAAQGKPEYEYVWKGAKWLFASAENRDRFMANPENYEPEYGGFCAWSAASGTMMESDPEQWKIVDGKLYLIQNGQVKQIWEKSETELIEKANKNWQEMKEK